MEKKVITLIQYLTDKKMKIVKHAKQSQTFSCCHDINIDWFAVIGIDSCKLIAIFYRMIHFISFVADCRNDMVSLKAVKITN